jgi:predicted nucleic-acid-binding protein
VIALDTNVLVRYLVKDDAAQAARAVSLIQGCVDRRERMFVGHIVLCEMTWVLMAGYSLSKNDVVAVLSQLIRTAQFDIESPDLVTRALTRYEEGRADFADYIITERAAMAGYETVATFDKKLLGQPGFIAP